MMCDAERRRVLVKAGDHRSIGARLVGRRQGARQPARSRGHVKGSPTPAGDTQPPSRHWPTSRRCREIADAATQPCTDVDKARVRLGGQTAVADQEVDEHEGAVAAESAAPPEADARLPLAAQGAGQGFASGQELEAADFAVVDAGSHGSARVSGAPRSRDALWPRVEAQIVDVLRFAATSARPQHHGRTAATSRRAASASCTR